MLGVLRWEVNARRAPSGTRATSSCRSRDGRSQSCERHWQRSYSDHDTQKCGIAGTDRDDSDDGSFSVDVRLHLPKCPAGLGSCGFTVLVIHLCVWLLQRGCVLLRVPWSAVVTLARVHFPMDGSVWRDTSASPFCWDLAARRGSGRLGRFIGAGSLCDQPSDYVKEAQTGALRWSPGEKNHKVIV
jgi:hypothetical protein